MRSEVLEREINKHRDRVLREVGRGGISREDCEDIVSRTVFKLLRSADRIDEDRPLLNFWLRVATREVLDFKKDKRNSGMESLDEMLDLQDPFSGSFEIDESEIAITTWANMLPRHLQEVFYLVFVEGQDQVKAAGNLNVNPHTVNRKVKEIRRILREGAEG